MPFVFKKTQKAVSTLIFIVIAMLLAIIILIGKGSNLFDLKDKYNTQLNEGHGLSSGATIKYKGIIIGKIRSMELTTNDKINIKVTVLRKYRYLIRKDSVLKVGGGIPGLGSASMSLMPSLDSNAVALAPGSLVFSSDMPQGQDILAELNKIQPKDDLMAKVNDVLEGVVDLKPLLMATMLNIRDSTSSLKAILGGLEGKESTVISRQIIMMMVKLNSVMTSMDSVMKNVDEMTEDDLKKIMLLLKEDLIEMKKVMQNLPFGMGTGESKEGATITGGDR